MTRPTSARATSARTTSARTTSTRHRSSRHHLAGLAAAHAGRPLLLASTALPPILTQLGLLQSEETPRPRGLAGLMRLVRGSSATVPAPTAFLYDDDDDSEPLTPEAYAAMLGEELRPSLAGLDPARVSGEGWGYIIVDRVAIIGLEGAIPPEGGYMCGAFHGYDTLARAFAEAHADERVSGVLAIVNSPGGVVAGGLPVLAAQIAAQRAAAGGKPVWVHGEMVASAAYWIAAQADRLVSSPYAMIGSIGAVIVHQSLAGMLEREGVAIEAIQFGESKTDGAWWAALSDTARADLQSEIDQIGQDFVAAVVSGRPSLEPAAVLATQARVFLADNRDASRSALALGLIDGLSADALTTLDALVAALPAAPAALAGGALPSQPAAAGSAVSGSATPGATGEDDMALRQKIQAALAARAEASSAEDTLDAIRELLDDTGESDDGEDDPEAEGAPGEDGEPEDPMAVAAAILKLPEAKGRETLAQELAFQKGQTVAQARTLLAAAPKASRLAGNVPNPDLGPAPASGGSSSPAASVMQIARARRASTQR
jgi:capsid assembly protease